jgi:hypothetical protein
VTSTYYDEIAKRESGSDIVKTPLNSSARYGATNSYNYLGKYQMGTAAMVDAGLYSGPIQSATQIWDDTKWTAKAIGLGITSKATFLESPSGQEAAIQAFTDKNWGYAISYGLDKYVGKTVDRVQITADGILAGIHLVGIGAAK